ncbi:MAG: succinate--CoA ligase subunit alpha [Candidatus Bipolaricaulia bacterium]
MSILIDENTRVLVQGITGSEGRFHTAMMVEYGTRVVAGVTPGKGGSDVDGIPVYNTVEAAMSAHQIDATAVFVPAPFAADAILEAAAAGIRLIVAITEHIPVHDMLKVYSIVRGQGATLIGPNCPGVISPGKSKIGIMPGSVFAPGRVGVVSRSGTLTYEIVDQLTQAGFGQSTAVGIGGDPIIGSNFVEILAQFENDPETELVVLVGEIGGTAEEEAAEFIAAEMDVSAVAYIAGFSAPPGKRMGHAGAIISGSGTGETAEAKADALEKRGIPIGRTPAQLAQLVKQSRARSSKSEAQA